LVFKLPLKSGENEAHFSGEGTSESSVCYVFFFSRRGKVFDEGQLGQRRSRALREGGAF